MSNDTDTRSICVLVQLDGLTSRLFTPEILARTGESREIADAVRSAILVALRMNLSKVVAVIPVEQARVMMEAMEIADTAMGVPPIRSNGDSQMDPLDGPQA